MKDNALMSVLGAAFFLNIIAINVFPPTFKELVPVGFVLLGFGLLLVLLSVLTLRGQGTDKVTDKGVYGLVRHPMYLGGLLLFFSHVFFCQHWLVILSTIIAIVCCYQLILSADKRNAEKFGDDYKRYMKKVPRMNLLSGIKRKVQHR